MELSNTFSHYSVESMISDETLMLRFQDGSREAFEELFHRYRDPLYGFFRRRLNQSSRAEELTQETFLAVIRASARYQPRALVRSYLYGIALKLVSVERRSHASFETPPMSAAAAPAPESAIWIQEALDRLEPMDREVLMLREYEEMSYSEIADLLRLPLNTVRSRLFRARLAMRQLLRPQEQTGGLWR